MMFYIVTPCSRPGLLDLVYESIPKENNIHWIIVHDNHTVVNLYRNASYLICEDTGMVGTKARNFVLDHFPFEDNDTILFHDDDNIIHKDLYSTISPYLDQDFSILCWGQLNKDESIKLSPTNEPALGNIDTASFAIKWKYNKNVRHKIDIYFHDAIYAQECSKNGPVITINKYLSYYNYLR